MNNKSHEELIRKLENRDFYVLNIRNSSKAKRPKSTGSICKLFNADITRISIKGDVATIIYKIKVGPKYIQAKLNIYMIAYMIDWSFDSEKLEQRRILYCIVLRNSSCGLFPSLTEEYLDTYFKNHNVIRIFSYADYEFLINWSASRNHILYMVNGEDYSMTLANA